MKIDIENLKKELFIDHSTEAQKKWINYYLHLSQNI